MLTAVSPSVAAPPDAPPRSTRDEIREAAEGFEALFLATLLRGARAGLPGDELTGGSSVRQVTDMLDTELAGSAASRAGLGIAEAVARQFAGPEDRS